MLPDGWGSLSKRIAAKGNRMINLEINTSHIFVANHQAT
jgi:hypothetical protein